jgi:hypothetical protein
MSPYTRRAGIRSIGAAVGLMVAMQVMVAPLAQAAVALTVGSMLTLDATPATATVGDQIDLSGQLTFADHSSSEGQTITLTRDDAGGTHALPDAVTGSDGSYALTDVVPVAGLVSYHAAFAGTVDADPSDATDTVSVAKLASKVSLGVSQHAVTFGRPVHLKAHLGRGTRSRVVAIYAKPDGGREKLIRKAKVDRHRDLQASFSPSKDTTFTARYEGDLSHRGAHDAALTRVRVIVTAKLVRNISTSGKYRIYRRGSKAPCVARVAPNHAGFPVRAVLQAFVHKRWHTLAKRSFRLNASSVRGIGITGSSNVNFRIRVSLATHADHLGSSSPWRYLRFT